MSRHDRGDGYAAEMRDRVAAVFELGRGTPVRYRLRGTRPGRGGDTYADLISYDGVTIVARPWGCRLPRRFSLARVRSADVARVETAAEVQAISARQRAAEGGIR